MLFSSTRISGGGSGGGSGSVTSITGTDSIAATPNPITTSGNLALVNDAVSPGSNHVYGTDGSGVKGWKPDPAGIGGTIAARQVAFGSAPNTIAGSNNFTWNNATQRFAVLARLSNIGTIGNLGATTTGQSIIGPTTFTFGTVNGVWNDIANSSTGDHAVVGAGDLTPFGGSTEAVYLLHESGAGDQALLYADTIGGQPSIAFSAVPSVGTGMGGQVTPSKFEVSDSTGGTYLTLDISTDMYSIGSIANGMHSVWDNSTKSYNLQFAGNEFMLVRATNASVQLGDISGAFSGGTLLIDGNANTATNNALVWDMGATNIQNVLDPLLAQDAATKAYVDSLVNGLNWKSTVDVATIGVLPTCTYANGAGGVGATLTSTGVAPLGPIDGYGVTVGQSILVKNQGTTLQNGIYVFTQDGDGISLPWILTRRTDNDTTAEMRYATVGVINNGSQAQTGWTQTDNSVGAPVIGTDPITFVEFLNSVYLPGTGLALAAHTFSLDAKLAPMDALAGNANKILSVNPTATAVKWITPPTTITLETNGTPNGSQTLLNLVAGSGVTISDDGIGDITISSSGGGGSTDLENYSLIASMRFLSGN